MGNYHKLFTVSKNILKFMSIMCAVNFHQGNCSFNHLAHIFHVFRNTCLFFLQALNMFTAAFQSGQLGPLMAQFGLGDKATEAANKGGKDNRINKLKTKYQAALHKNLYWSQAFCSQKRDRTRNENVFFYLSVSVKNKTSSWNISVASTKRGEE